MEVRTRFAPSPTGFMHIGNLRTALYAYLYARANGGKFIIRIEDTDQGRYVEGAVDVIFRTLEQAGIDYDEGPGKEVGGYPYVQSERKEIYKKYAEELIARGGAYYCFCKGRDMKDGGTQKYDKRCLRLSKEEVAERLARGESYVVRQNIPETDGVSSYTDLVYGEISVAYKDMEDAVLLKSDGMPTYNFANVVDDHLMGITHVIRGNEYLSSTPKYNLIYDAFGWERPQYIHLPPIMKDKERKLSKRYGDANFDDFVKKGYLPKAIVNYIALLGWSPKNNEEMLSMEDLIRLFSVDGVCISPAIFDEAKLRWLNASYIKNMTEEEFIEAARPFLDASKVGGKYDYSLLAPLLIPRVEVLSEIPSLVNFLEEFGEYDIAIYDHQKMKTNGALALKALRAALPAIEGMKEWDMTALHDLLVATAENSEMKKGQMLWSFRIAITGQASTPGGATEMAALLGKEECLRRMRFSMDLLERALA
ncbi:MAG TPA: glutamate--tRNA ligase [Clostridiales bacterium]|nr:glutamate--tRNA ligase [Clostridiales bacterium]